MTRALRPGTAAASAAVTGARAGDALLVHTLHRLARTVRDTLKPIHEPVERDVG